MALMLVGTALLFGYGFSLNLAPAEFGQVVGLYIATLFVVGQIINAVAFQTLPTLPVAGHCPAHSDRHRAFTRPCSVWAALVFQIGVHPFHEPQFRLRT